MTIIQGSERDHGEQPYSEGPFAETAWTEQEDQAPADSSPEALGYLPWTEETSPFGAEGFGGAVMTPLLEGAGGGESGSGFGGVGRGDVA